MNEHESSERSAVERAREYLDVLGEDEWKLSVLDALLERVRGIPLDGIAGEVTRELVKLRSKQLRERRTGEQRVREFLRELNTAQLRALDEFLEQERELSAELSGTDTGKFLASVEKLRNEQRELARAS